MYSIRLISMVAIVSIVFPLWAAPPAKPSVIPPEFQWVRSFESDGYMQSVNGRDTGVQHFHFRLRYRDPDVNNFIGMQLDFDHFNRELSLGNPDNPSMGNGLFDMGAHIGVLRKSHTWELELMGITAAGKLGPAFAL